MISCRNISFEDDLDWDDLIKESNTSSFFQTKDWLFLWVRHFGKEYKIFGVFDGDSLIGIVPFQIDNGLVSFLGVSPVLGGELVSDFGDIVALEGREKEVWEMVIKELRRKKKELRINNIELNFIREDSQSLKILQELGGKTEETDVVPYLDLPKTWEEYLDVLDRHDRHELRRKIRILEKEGAFKICYEGDPSDIDEFFRLMALSNDQKRDFLSEKMKIFFRDIFAVFWPDKMIELCFLKLEGKNIAATLSFIFKNEVLLYNSGFDPKYAYLSPGLLLKAFLIKHAIEEGRRKFEFLRGGERYKYDLGGRERKLYKFSF